MLVSTMAVLCNLHPVRGLVLHIPRNFYYAQVKSAAMDVFFSTNKLLKGLNEGGAISMCGAICLPLLHPTPGLSGSWRSRLTNGGC